MNTHIDLRIEWGENSGASECRLGGLRIHSNFIFDCLHEFGRNGDKFDAHSYSPEAIADLAASLEHDAGSREPEAQFQDRALRILRARVDEHAMQAKVRRPNGNVLLEAFVNHGKFTH